MDTVNNGISVSHLLTVHMLNTDHRSYQDSSQRSNKKPSSHGVSPRSGYSRENMQHNSSTINLRRETPIKLFDIKIRMTLIKKNTKPALPIIT